MIKERLTRSLAQTTPDVVDEVQRGFEELIPATDNGTSRSSIYTNTAHIIRP